MAAASHLFYAGAFFLRNFAPLWKK